MRAAWWGVLVAGCLGCGESPPTDIESRLAKIEGDIAALQRDLEIQQGIAGVVTARLPRIPKIIDGYLKETSPVLPSFAEYYDRELVRMESEAALGE